MIQLKRLPLESVPWGECDSLPDRTIYQTRSWLNFLEDAKGGEPVVATGIFTKKRSATALAYCELRHQLVFGGVSA